KILLDRLQQYLQDWFSSLGGAMEPIRQKKAGNLLKITFTAPNSIAGKKTALILCHYDTVWPEATISARPFKIVAGKAFGPGVLDMKGGIVLVYFALQAIRGLNRQLPRPVILLLTGDEEIGSPVSRQILEKIAVGAKYVLVPEAPLPNGVLKTARKGVGRFRIKIQGKAAHSGIEPEKGISAVTELARQILFLNRLGDVEKGTTINVGLVKGGTKLNVVAPVAEAELEVRVWQQNEADRVEAAINNLQPVQPGISFNVTGGFNRPPMERTQDVQNLFSRAKELGKSLGLNLQEGATGGAGDGNFTAALGIPTLDGLGPPGEGAHAEHEHVILQSFPQRAALIASLLLSV
ncbi:MAG TPA: M20 family peptidase, partial [Bacteroidetes bacterium]|nr:M20 family peptidase [Bacteroidota bacterium]